jgi:DNA-directed RNA polymerase subunit L
MIKLPTPVVKKGLEEYNSVKHSIEGRDHSILNVIHPLLNKSTGSSVYKFPIDKNSIIENSSAMKNASINILNQSLNKN